MGERYILEVLCPNCGILHDNIPYAPTCGWIEFVCSNCKHCVDLTEYTGISYEDASNADIMKQIIDEVTEEWVELDIEEYPMEE